MAKKVVSAGQICLDITPVFTNKEKKPVQELFLPGKVVGMGPADIHCGGSSANSGLAFSFFGADTTIMAKIGSDPFGAMLQNDLQRHGANADLIVAEDMDSSYSIVLSPPGIDRIFLHHFSAGGDFSCDDVDYDVVREADLFHFGYPTAMPKIYQNGGADLLRMFQTVKSLGIRTSLDLCLVDAEGPHGQVDWPPILQQLLPFVDFFVPSIEELCFFTNRPLYAEWLRRAGSRDITDVLDLEADIKPLAGQMLSWGAKIVLIKCGAPGMYLRCADETTLAPLGAPFAAWAGLDVFEASYVPDSFCAATGAGDVSLAAFLLAAIEGYTPARCLQLATAAGASCVTAYDALSGLLPFADLMAKIDAGWKKAST